MVTRYVKDNFLYAAGDTIVGQVRKANEDNCGYCKTPNGELFVVCDGMGGHVGGATASHIAVESIVNFISQQVSSNKAELIDQALRFANTQILGTAANDPSLRGMGTTACVLLVDGQDIWIGHVGDSRIYMYSRQDNYLYRITKDHSLVQSLVDRGELDDRDAENHPQKNIILLALGTKPEVQPDVERTPLRAQVGDTFLICSDGLSGMIDDNEIETIMRQNSSIEDMVQNLIDAANMPGKGKDNITAQLIQVLSSTSNVSSHPNHNPRWRAKGGIGNSVQQAGNAGRRAENPIISANMPQRKQSSSWIPALSAAAAVIIIAVITGFIFAFPKIKGKLKEKQGSARTEVKKECTTQAVNVQPVESDSIKFVQDPINLNKTHSSIILTENVSNPKDENDKKMLKWVIEGNDDAQILGVNELDVSNITNKSSKKTTYKKFKVTATDTSGKLKENSFTVSVEIEKSSSQKEQDNKDKKKKENQGTSPDSGTKTTSHTTETGTPIVESSGEGEKPATPDHNQGNNEDKNVGQGGETPADGAEPAASPAEEPNKKGAVVTAESPNGDKEAEVVNEQDVKKAERNVGIKKQLKLEDIFEKEEKEQLYKQTKWTSNDTDIVTIVNYNNKIAIQGNKKGETKVIGIKDGKEAYLINVHVK